MNIVNMKRDPSDNYGESAMASPNYDGGLCLYLTDDQCEKLGITSVIEPGTAVRIEAQAIVTRATTSLEDDGDDAGNDVSLSLQITDIGIESMGLVPNAATKLYGSP